MPVIQLTPDTLRSKAAQLENNRTLFDNTVNAVQTLINSLPEQWHGQAQKAFVEGFQAKEKIYRQFSADMETFKVFMENYANVMESADDVRPTV